ncbi:MAG TPA: hypothetical protein VJH22_06210 [Candidatus Nanoarchaeia archaeon]|nr:hypothetical protein [Candidatus Nanoarchaeia archaeon]
MVNFISSTQYEDLRRYYDLSRLVLEQRLDNTPLSPRHLIEKISEHTVLSLINVPYEHESEAKAIEGAVRVSIRKTDIVQRNRGVIQIMGLEKPDGIFCTKVDLALQGLRKQGLSVPETSGVRISSREELNWYDSDPALGIDIQAAALGIDYREGPLAITSRFPLSAEKIERIIHSVRTLHPTLLDKAKVVTSLLAESAHYLAFTPDPHCFPYGWECRPDVILSGNSVSVAAERIIVARPELTYDPGSQALSLGGEIGKQYTK